MFDMFALSLSTTQPQTHTLSLSFVTWDHWGSLTCLGFPPAVEKDEFALSHAHTPTCTLHTHSLCHSRHLRSVKLFDLLRVSSGSWEKRVCFISSTHTHTHSHHLRSLRLLDLLRISSGSIERRVTCLLYLSLPHKHTHFFSLSSPEIIEAPWLA